MVYRRRLGSNEALHRDRRRQDQKQKTQTMVGRTAVTRGQLRVASQEGLLVQGSQRTTGTNYIDGLLNGTGTLQWSGPVNLTGNTSIGGSATITGDLVTSGETTLRGDLSLESDLRVRAGGKITVEGSATPVEIGVIGPAGEAGVSFGAAQLRSTNGIVVLANGQSQVGVNASTAVLAQGNTAIRIINGVIQIIGLTRLPAGVAADDMVIAAAGGTLYRDS